METSTIVSLSVSGVVAMIQVINFLEARSAKKEAEKTVFAKANEVKIVFDKMEKEFGDNLTRLNNKSDNHGSAIHNQEINISVIQTQIIGIDKSLDHISETLDAIIARVSNEDK